MEISNTYALNQSRRVTASSESDQQRNTRGSASGVTFDNESGRPQVDRSNEQRFDPLLDDRRLQGRLVTDARNQPVSGQTDSQRRTETIAQRVQQAYQQGGSTEVDSQTASAARQAAYQDTAIDYVV